MRHLIGTAAIVALAAGTLTAAPAFAGFDEAHQNSFWGSQSSGSAAGDRHGAYLTMDPRDAKAAPNAPAEDQADASNPYFNHAEGTMNGPAVAATPAPDNSRYTATYQSYMQVEPRDQKVTPRTDTEATDDTFYHAMGTMGRP